MDFKLQHASTREAWKQQTGFLHLSPSYKGFSDGL